MSTLQQVREGLNEAWDSLLDGWQRLYRRAAGAITRFTPGRQTDQAVANRDSGGRSIGWGVLAAEVFDSDDSIVVRLEVPGMDGDGFDIQVQGNNLVVRGEKQLVHEQTRGHYRVTECAYGRFQRVVPLSEEVDGEGAHASYRHGVLRVELPRSRRSRRTIKVNVN
jgi:HSP20 family protein